MANFLFILGLIIGFLQTVDEYDDKVIAAIKRICDLEPAVISFLLQLVGKSEISGGTASEKENKVVEEVKKKPELTDKIADIGQSVKDLVTIVNAFTKKRE